MARQLPQTGHRVSLRRVRNDGEVGDVVGFVLTAGESGFAIRDRRGHVHELGWERVLAWREVGVARGRDPLRAPLAELDLLARAAGVEGRVFVARLCDLLDASVAPPVPDFEAPPPRPAVLRGEWATTGEVEGVLEVAWWAAHRDARSLQVRTASPAEIGLLLTGGFTERTT